MKSEQPHIFNKPNLSSIGKPQYFEANFILFVVPPNSTKQHDTFMKMETMLSRNFVKF